MKRWSLAIFSIFRRDSRMRVIRWKTRLTIRSAIARRMPASCFSGFADYVLQRELGSQRYADPDVPSRDHPADILPTELDRLREMMLGLINQPEHFKQWFGEFITQSRHELDVAPPEPPYQPDEIYDALQQGDTLERLGGLRVLRIDGEVFVNGEKINSPHRPALDALATHLTLRADHFGDALEDPSFLAMLAALVNSGYWFFGD